ncbi:MarR family winged helix-turn-helix transcriptional regulator [Pseudanabaena minima]|uniref:MarR family winged helix-turn-helix transcriptional regulator n=1 Tax=Pseudanabaena minima TaxID=890415 RepID=UPI003DAA191E
MSTNSALDPLRSSVWRSLLTVHIRLLDRIAEKLTQADLPPLEWYDVLLTLKEAPDYSLRLSELAEKVLLSRSNLTRLVDRLEKADLLYRKSCPSDRRGTYAVLTEAGLAMQQKMWIVYSEGISDYFASHISEDEARTLQQICDRLLSNLAQLNIKPKN